MRAALPHAYAQWSDDPDNYGEMRYGYSNVGRMRLVRNPKRARLLRRRGVDLMDTGERTSQGHKVWAWFTEIESGQHDPSTTTGSGNARTEE